MRNEEQRLLASGLPGAKEATSRAEESRQRQRMRGVAGQLRPYREVRAGFEAWRRIALAAWGAREEGATAH